MLAFSGPPSELLVGLAIDLVAIILLVGVGYLPLRRGNEMTFMLVTINIVVFGIAYAMLHVSLGVGAAFGLFALFGILRFRTGTLDVTEMSFLFAALALAVVNSSGLTGLNLGELLLINGTTLIALIGGARVFFAGVVEYGETKVLYDRADLLAADDNESTFADLRARTGLDVHAITVLGLDLTCNTATLRVYHGESTPRNAGPVTTGIEVDAPESNGSNGSRLRVIVDPNDANLFIAPRPDLTP